MPDGEIGNENSGLRAYASPSCFMHEVGRLYVHLHTHVHPERRAAIFRWRNEERKRLIGERLALASATRADHAGRIAINLDTLLPDVTGRIISFCWPFRAEPDLRGWIGTILDRGGRCALPVVVEIGMPLVFRSWRSGEPLVPGFWNIPVPERGREVTPDIILAPLVGFDSQGFRLGYGGGYFDRTLPSLQTRPYVVGLGFAQARVSTIFPLDHDIAMDAIVTERGIEGYGRKLGRLCRSSSHRDSEALR
jgi:5-formyltetrahydrofolate cyclo-ligase